MNRRLTEIPISSLPQMSLTDRNLLPSSSVVYFLCQRSRSDPNRMDLLYIGQASDLKVRWAGSKHHIYRKLAEGQKTGCWLHWMDCPEPFLDSIEKELVGYYQPPLNQRLKVVEAPPKPSSKPKKASTSKKAKSSPKAAQSKAQNPMESFREYARSCASSRIFYPGI